MSNPELSANRYNSVLIWNCPSPSNSRISTLTLALVSGSPRRTGRGPPSLLFHSKRLSGENRRANSERSTPGQLAKAWGKPGFQVYPTFCLKGGKRDSGIDTPPKGTNPKHSRSPGWLRHPVFPWVKTQPAEEGSGERGPFSSSCSTGRPAPFVTLQSSLSQQPHPRLGFYFCPYF